METSNFLPIAPLFISFALLLKKLKQMKQIAVILLIALSATANAQERIVNKYKNGQVASEGVLVQGKENGLWTYYDSTI